jgi:hypothetical protein
MFYNNDIIEILKQQIDMLKNASVETVEQVVSNLETAVKKLTDRENELLKLDAKLEASMSKSNLTSNHNTKYDEGFIVNEKGRLLYWKKKID